MAISTMAGTVVAVQANFYMVHLINGQRLLCTQREKLKKIGTKAMVGDLVEVAEWQMERGVLEAVAERRSELDRPPIANVDRIALVFAAADPPIEPFTLSKFLVKAESMGVPVLLCLNKCDLVSPAEQQVWIDRLSAWGYPPLLISTLNGTGMAELREQLKETITVFAGHSGVGKSSLINALIPGCTIRVATVSGKLQRGRHTTRHVELFDLPEGGLIADTPGFNQPDIKCLPGEVALYFPEISRQVVEPCQFSDCLHSDEPGCAIDKNWERYDHYRAFLIDAEKWQQHQAHQRQPEARWKQKSKGGSVAMEPRLAAKQYRRPSRRSQTQDLPEGNEDAGED
jgi:ribosome biogenesis GTPase / thiamine phosphate phosphatase